MSVCVNEYKDDIEGGVQYYCDLLIEDFDGNKQKAFDYAEKHGCWEDIAFHIIGDPDYDNARAEVYHAIMEAAKKSFEVKLLGTY
jgi:hypothetical protein